MRAGWEYLAARPGSPFVATLIDKRSTKGSAGGSGESFGNRWKRRAVTIPSMLLTTVAAFLAFPFLVPLAILVDLARLRFRLPTLRVYLFVLQYLWNDSAEIVTAPVLWVVAGFGTRLHSPASIQRHQALQWWSVRLLRRRAEQLLGVRVELSPASSEAAFGDGPVIVLSRHVSLFDASLPGILYETEDFVVRGIIMAELLNDPGFDLIYSRTGSVFIPRDNGAEARASIDHLARSVTDRTAVVLFPEGRLFGPAVLERQLHKLAATEPARHDRLAGLSTVLPPRPGGLLALLEALPEADVVVLDHRGLEKLGTLRRLMSTAPLATPVTVDATRIARADIPTDAEQQVAWLDDLWLNLDHALRQQNNPR